MEEYFEDEKFGGDLKNDLLDFLKAYSQKFRIEQPRTEYVQECIDALIPTLVLMVILLTDHDKEACREKLNVVVEALCKTTDGVWAEPQFALH